jgi:hypothetical protein
MACACQLPNLPAAGQPVGGSASGARANDLHLLELSSFSWSQPPLTGAAPPSPRQAAALAIVHGHYLLVRRASWRTARRATALQSHCSKA